MDLGANYIHLYYRIGREQVQRPMQIDYAFSGHTKFVGYFNSFQITKSLYKYVLQNQAAIQYLWKPERIEMQRKGANNRRPWQRYLGLLRPGLVLDQSWDKHKMELQQIFSMNPVWHSPEVYIQGWRKYWKKIMLICIFCGWLEASAPADNSSC